MSEDLSIQFLFFFFVGIICIIFGIFGIITDKTRSHLWSGFRIVNKKTNPGEYWLYIGLLLGIGLLCVIASIVFFMYS